MSFAFSQQVFTSYGTYSYGFAAKSSAQQLSADRPPIWPGSLFGLWGHGYLFTHLRISPREGRFRYPTSTPPKTTNYSLRSCGPHCPSTVIPGCSHGLLWISTYFTSSWRLQELIYCCNSPPNFCCSRSESHKTYNCVLHSLVGNILCIPPFSAWTFKCNHSGSHTEVRLSRIYLGGTAVCLIPILLLEARHIATSPCIN